MKKLTMLCSALVCLAAAPAFAASTTCAGVLQGQYIQGALTVPAGATCKLIGDEVTGNVSVQGLLLSYGTRFDGNVGVTGGSIVLSNGNGMGSPIMGNLSITGSTGNNILGSPNSSNIILGNFSFTGNSGNLYVAQATVGGNVTISNNVRINNDYSGPYVADIYSITARSISCDGNYSSNGTPAITGAGNSAPKTGQCSAL